MFLVKLAYRNVFAIRRCKHNCKSSCRHKCCQRSRDLNDSTATRRYRFQDRSVDANHPSPALRVGVSSTQRPDGPTSPQKRKAIEALDADDDDSLDLLGRLDRLFPQPERIPTPAGPVRMPRGDEMDALSLGELEHRDGDNSPMHRSMSLFTESNASSAPASAAVTSERPPQRRFLKSLGNPSWLSGAGAADGSET